MVEQRLERHEVKVPIGNSLLLLDLASDSSFVTRRDAILCQLERLGLQALSGSIFMMESESAESKDLLVQLHGLLELSDAIWIVRPGTPLAMIHLARNNTEEGIRASRY